MTDNKAKDITFGEFQHWMSGLIEGKCGKLPDLEDWKKIKAMMDRVKPDTEVIALPTLVPHIIPPHDSYPWNNPPVNPYQPSTDPVWPNDIWCGTITTSARLNNTSPDLDVSAPTLDVLN